MYEYQTRMCKPTGLVASLFASDNSFFVTIYSSEYAFEIPTLLHGNAAF
jgi:hypothetical protein